MATINNLIWSTSPGTSGISFTGGSFSADKGKSIRVKSDGTGLEFFTPEYGDLTAVTGTTPIVVTSGTGPIPNVTINGVSGYGSANQFVITTGSAWSYVTGTGSGGVPVRSIGPTITSARFVGVTSAQEISSEGVNTDILTVGSGSNEMLFFFYGTNFHIAPDTSLSSGIIIDNNGGITATSLTVSDSVEAGSAIILNGVFKAEYGSGTRLGFFDKAAVPPGQAPAGAGTVVTEAANPVLSTSTFMTQFNTNGVKLKAIEDALKSYGLLAS